MILYKGDGSHPDIWDNITIIKQVLTGRNRKMATRNIEIVSDGKGHIGLQCRQYPCDETSVKELEEDRSGKPADKASGKHDTNKRLMIAWVSPYATVKQNEWLESRLRKTYLKYFKKVSHDNTGLFW